MQPAQPLTCILQSRVALRVVGHSPAWQLPGTLPAAAPTCSLISQAPKSPGSQRKWSAPPVLLKKGQVCLMYSTTGRRAMVGLPALTASATPGRMPACQALLAAALDSTLGAALVVAVPMPRHSRAE